MCLTSLGKILKVEGNTAVVQLRKSQREVRIDLLKVKEGDYVYVSGNLGIEKIEAEEAEEILKTREEAGDIGGDFE